MSLMNELVCGARMVELGCWHEVISELILSIGGIMQYGAEAST